MHKCAFHLNLYRPKETHLVFNVLHVVAGETVLVARAGFLRLVSDKNHTTKSHNETINLGLASHPVFFFFFSKK